MLPHRLCALEFLLVADHPAHHPPGLVVREGAVPVHDCLIELLPGTVTEGGGSDLQGGLARAHAGALSGLITRSLLVAVADALVLVHRRWVYVPCAVLALGCYESALLDGAAHRLRFESEFLCCFGCRHWSIPSK